MQFTLLADRPEAIPQIAEWYFDQWGHLGKDTGPEDIERQLQHSLNHDVIPLIVMAVANDEIMGVAELKFREMKMYPEKEHWLGGVYVAAEHRGKGVASQLIRQTLRKAHSLDVSTLYLQTEQLDGGLYARLGWVPIEQVNHHGLDVLVMERSVDDGLSDTRSTIPQR